MAVLSAYFTPGAATSVTVATGATSAEQAVGGGLVAIAVAAASTASQVNIAFGQAGSVATPTANDWPIFTGSFQIFDLSQGGITSFKVYNPATASVTIWWIPLV